MEKLLFFFKIQLLCFLLFSGTLCFLGKNVQANALLKNTQKTAEITIESDQMEVFQKKGITRFFGHVKAKRQSMTLESAELFVFQELNRDQGGSQKITSLKAMGGVKITSPQQKITGDTAIIDPTQKTLVVEGNVFVSQKDGILRGPRLEVDLVTQHSKMLGGRVRGVFKQISP